jgi:hypothetical protein
MSWKFFLTQLRRLLFWRRMPARRSSSKRPPDRRKRHFDFEPFEDRSHMEPPITSLAATAAGLAVGTYAVNLALVNAQARAAASVAAPAVPETITTNLGPVLEGAAEARTAEALVWHDYTPTETWLPGERLAALETDRPLADSLPDSLNEDFKPASAVGGGSSLASPFDAPAAADEGGGSGAEPGGRTSPAGGSAPSSSGPTSPLNGGTLAAPVGATGTNGSGATPFSFPGGVGLSGSRTPPTRSAPSGSGSPIRVSPLASPSGGTQVGGGSTAITSTLEQNFASSPVYFEANQGQTDPSVQFLTRNSNYTAYLRAAGPTFELGAGGPANADSTRTVDMVSFAYQGANANAIVRGQDQLLGRSNYFAANSAFIDIPQFASVRYQNYYPNIDLVYHPGTADPTQLEYDFVVQPGGNPNLIQFNVAGAQSLSLDLQGNLDITTPDGTLVAAVPVATEIAPGGVTPISVNDSYVLLGGNTVGVVVSGYNSADTLTIDPTLTYSTYLGGSGTDVGNGIAVDGFGNVYVTGNTTSINFPGTSGRQNSNQIGFVSKLSADGKTLLYSTYLNSGFLLSAQAIAVDAGGNAYVTGNTTGGITVTTGAYQTVYGGGSGDAFVMKLNAAGDNTVYSTYLGGSAADYGYGIAVDAAGDAFVTGYTASGGGFMSSPFPTTSGAYQTTFGGGSQDGFVTELNPAGSGLVVHFTNNDQVSEPAFLVD